MICIKATYLKFPKLLILEIVIGGLLIASSLYYFYWPYPQQQIAYKEKMAIKFLHRAFIDQKVYFEAHGVFAKDWSEIFPIHSDIINFRVRWKDISYLPILSQHTEADYYINVNPTSLKCRFFYLDQTGVIRSNYGHPAGPLDTIVWEIQEIRGKFRDGEIQGHPLDGPE